jgi:hypothetical protein
MPAHRSHRDELVARRRVVIPFVGLMAIVGILSNHSVVGTQPLAADTTKSLAGLIHPDLLHSRPGSAGAGRKRDLGGLAGLHALCIRDASITVDPNGRHGLASPVLQSCWGAEIGLLAAQQQGQRRRTCCTTASRSWPALDDRGAFNTTSTAAPPAPHALSNRADLDVGKHERQLAIARDAAHRYTSCSLCRPPAREPRRDVVRSCVKRSTRPARPEGDLERERRGPRRRRRHRLGRTDESGFGLAAPHAEALGGSFMLLA